MADVLLWLLMVTAVTLTWLSPAFPTLSLLALQYLQINSSTPLEISIWICLFMSFSFIEAFTIIIGVRSVFVSSAMIGLVVSYSDRC